jgi:hypothetical protein
MTQRRAQPDLLLTRDLLLSAAQRLYRTHESRATKQLRCFCDAQVLRLVTGRNGPLPRQLYLSDFGRITKGRFAIANPPHNAPMFRHARVQACAHVSICFSQDGCMTDVKRTRRVAAAGAA